MLTEQASNDNLARSSTRLSKCGSLGLEIHASSLLKILYYIKSTKISNLTSEDITFAEYIMLRLIAEIETETESPEVWVSDIVKRVEITPQAVSKFIHSAVNKGYVERFENANDRRSTGVRISDRGRAALTRTGEDLSVFFNSVFSEFSEEEKTTMHGLMCKLHKVVKGNYSKHRKK
jgi:DNA-binding MarR family transcriptional regulator